MPRRVDHDQRRDLIAGSAIQIAAEHGAEAVTLAKVANAAGVSKGMLQYYFSTRQELIRAACQIIHDRTFSAVETYLLNCSSTASRQRLAGVIISLSFPNEARKYDSLALRALFLTAVGDPELNIKWRAGRRRLLELFEIQLLMHWGQEQSSTSQHRAQEAARFIYGSLQEVGESIILGELTPTALSSEIEGIVEHACQWPEKTRPARELHLLGCADCLS